jgi:hypothetical protein
MEVSGRVVRRGPQAPRDLKALRKYPAGGWRAARAFLQRFCLFLQTSRARRAKQRTGR